MADKGKCPEAPEPQGPNGGYQSRRRLYDSLTDIVTRNICSPSVSTLANPKPSAVFVGRILYGHYCCPYSTNGFGISINRR